MTTATQDYRNETTVLKHTFATRPSSPGVVEHYHDIGNCDLCRLLDERPTVDACIIAALETKLEETERELRLAIERALDAEARLNTAHDALHDWGTKTA